MYTLKKIFPYIMKWRKGFSSTKRVKFQFISNIVISFNMVGLGFISDSNSCFYTVQQTYHLIKRFKFWRLLTGSGVYRTFVQPEMELFVRLVNSSKTLNIVTRSSVLDILKVLHLLLSINLTAIFLSLITIEKLLSAKFVLMLAGQWNCIFFLFVFPFLHSFFFYITITFKFTLSLICIFFN